MRRRRGHVTDRALCAGPARLCEALGITGDENGTSLVRGTVRILRDRGRPAVAATTRIGITRGVSWPLRFVIRGSPWTSR
jgi:DNA-3-methyladenine glycosylase